MSTMAPSVLDALVHPDDAAAGLASYPPQAVLVEALDALTPDRLTLDGRIDAMVALERHIAMLQARTQEMLAAIDRDDGVDAFTRDSVAAALRLPPASMKSRLAVATDLTRRFPATLELLRAGEISQRHATELVEATRALPADTAQVVEQLVLPKAPQQTVAQFRASVRRAVLGVSDAAEQAAAHVDARAQRRVVVTPVDNGMAELWALLPAEDAATIKTTLDAMAHETIHGRGGDCRTADQRRADALVRLASVALDDAALTRGHGLRPAVHVTVAASTLMGLDDQPAELDGHGPITAGMARRIAGDETATWHRLLTDDDGRVLHLSSTTYRPPAALAATVIARDQHCTFPGCRRSARYADLDHVLPYRPGDRTWAGNLTALCRRHHRLKHSGRWQVRRDEATGTMTWIDRRGRSYTSTPPPVPTSVDRPASAHPPPL